MPDATPERSVVGKMTRCPEHDAKPLSTAPNGATLHFLSPLCGGTGSRRKYSDAVISGE